MATIGELVINLNCNTASFVTDLNRVKNLSFDTATQVQRSFTLIGTAALGMLGTAAAAMVGMVDHTVELETHILHLAAASGMSVESMSGLAFVAKLFGMQVDSIASAMEKFDKQLIAAQLGNAKASQNMSLLGIDPATIQTSDQALLQLSAHFAAMPDGILKTGEAMLAFSKNGAQMLELLNQGPAAIQKYLDMARSLGLVFDKEDAEGALHFKQNLEILKGSFEGFQIQVEKAILPNLNALTDELVKVRTETRSGGTAIDSLKFSFQTIASVLVLLVDSYKQFDSSTRTLGETIGAVAIAAVAGFSAIGAAAIGNFDEAKKSMQSMKDSWSLAGAAMADGDKRAAAIQSETAARLLAITGDGTKATAAMQKALDSLSAATGAKAIAAYQKSVEALIEKEKIASETVGMSAQGVQLYTLAVKAAELGDTAWAASKIEQIRLLEMQAAAIKEIVDWNLRQGQNEIDSAANLKLLQQQTIEMGNQLDLSMKMSLVPFSPFGPPQAFTDSLTQQEAALQHAIATFGMTSDAIALYDLQMLNANADNSKAIAGMGALQVQLKGLQDAAGAAAKSAATNAAAWKQFGDVAYKSLSDMIFSGKSFAQVLSDVTKQLGELFLKWSLFGFGNKSGGIGGIFGSLFGGLFGGGSMPGADAGVLSSLGLLSGLPTFASGGAVSAGVPIMVGENGPEMFVPSTAGAIIPHGGAGPGGSAVVNYYIDARGSSITEEQFRRSLAISENNAVQRSLNMTREIQARTA